MLGLQVPSSLNITAGDSKTLVEAVGDGKEQRRRKYERFPLRWKTAVVFDKPDGEVVFFHTHTEDLSVGGTSVFSERGDLANATVTALLARPDSDVGGVEMIKIRAQIVSSVHMSSAGAFRLGLKFLHSSYEEERGFAEVLKEATAQAPATSPA